MGFALKLAIGLYCLVGVLLILGGLGYLVRSEYLPYHEAATGIPWRDLSSAHRGTYLGLLKGGGGGGVTTGLALIGLSISGLRRGVELAFWMTPLLGITFLVTMNYSTWYMNSTTAGGPPIQVGMTLLVLVLVAASQTIVGLGVYVLSGELVGLTFIAARGVLVGALAGSLPGRMEAV